MRIFALVVIAVACSHRQPVGELRFHNQAPVWRVNDREPLASIPRERHYYRGLYHTDGFFARRATRTMDMTPHVYAQDVNALDEVPDSTWFTNRIGVRDLSIEELKRGPNVDPSPFDHRPWKLSGAKSGGMSLGFTFEDARGEKYILKFDKPSSPEMETGAHVIVHRILWAIGYNVPQDRAGYIRREDLVVKPGARWKRGTTNRPLDDAAVDRALAQVFRDSDGRYRVLASKFLPGKPIGPYSREGVRRDDPNDVIPHENRRSLRGQYAIFSWLNHSDIQEDQSLDMFIEDKTRPDKRGYVRHYLLDFGKALGTMGYHLRWQTVGHTYRVDWGIALRTLFTLGLWKRPWDGLDAPGIRGIGLFDAKHFEPGQWRANSFYWPFEDQDRFDAFWGAKLLVRFTREQLAAIVDEAQYSDPRASQYMLETLIARQRKTARYWFDRVAPLDQFTVEPEPTRGSVRVCFTDLLLAYDLRRIATRYRVEGYDERGTSTGLARTLGAMPGGRTCVNGVELAPYTILRFSVMRNAHVMPPVVVHIARDPRGHARVIGLRRR